MRTEATVAYFPTFLAQQLLTLSLHVASSRTMYSLVGINKD
jgi:hypothetical protein